MTAGELQQLVQSFVRSFGLLPSNQTPCGQPMSLSQAHALQLLVSSAACSQSELVRNLHLEKSTVSRLVDSLVNRGWVERVPNPQSRRENHLVLTPSGRNVAEKLAAASTSRFEVIWQRLPSDQRQQVQQALATLVAALDGE